MKLKALDTIFDSTFSDILCQWDRGHGKSQISRKNVTCSADTKHWSII